MTCLTSYPYLILTMLDFPGHFYLPYLSNHICNWPFSCYLFFLLGSYPCLSSIFPYSGSPILDNWQIIYTYQRNEQKCVIVCNNWQIIYTYQRNEQKCVIVCINLVSIPWNITLCQCMYFDVYKIAYSRSLIEWN